MAQTDQIQKEFSDIAASIRLCYRRLEDITAALNSSGNRSAIAQELRRSAETFSLELASIANALESAVTITAEDLGGSPQSASEVAQMRDRLPTLEKGDDDAGS